MVYRKPAAMKKAADRMDLRLSFPVAQELGFEPRHPVTGLQAFQACPFNHLGIPARGFVLTLRYDTTSLPIRKPKNLWQKCLIDAGIAIS